jgi:hypothetical protein
MALQWHRVRSIRKHRVALFALAAYHFVFFFPTLFMHRVVSPNDVFFSYAPWSEVRQVDPQNSLLNDPPTSYFTLLSLVKNDWRAFHWNPFVASGIPGFGSAASASLTPFSILPALLLPLSWVYTGIIFLKLNVAFLFTYLWLREERLGKGAAAVGAIIFAASGAIAVRWLWQATNAVALYPALLWIVRRVANGKRTPFWAMLLIALAYALAGFPAAMAYGAWIALVYLLILSRRRAVKPIAWAAVAVVLALLIAAPTLAPLIQFVKRTGYLDVRGNAALEHAFPLHHFRMFLWPDALGSKTYKNWNGDKSLGILNNYVEATVYLGLLTIPLVALALFNRRARTRWFWFAAAAAIVACMFGFQPLMHIIGALPGFKYSPLTRLQMLLPLPAAYLAAAGARTRRFRVLLPAAIAVLSAFDLGVFAGRFYPYLDMDNAVPPTTPTIAFLQAQPKPFRIAPFFVYLWPNSSELYGLEDVRSHFSSEAKYRALLHRIDPTSFGNTSTVITFNSLHFDFADPLVSMLGIRYLIENRDIDIVKWTIFKNTIPLHKIIKISPGSVFARPLTVDQAPFYAIELPMDVYETKGANPRVVVTLIRGNAALFSRAFTPADIKALGRVYIPLHGPGAYTVRVQSIGIKGTIAFYGRVTRPIVFDRELPDGRLFRNLAEVPRFHAVTALRKMTDAEFLATKNIDFLHEAAADHAATFADARVGLKTYAEDKQEMVVSAAGPAFLASSEKLTPELRVTIDGREVAPEQVNMLFAGVPVPAGTHEVIFSRRIGRGWWWIAAVALIAAIALAIIDVARRRSTRTRSLRTH